jgi:hypothetical protein
MVDIVNFNPAKHPHQWQEFILSSYRNPNYVLLSPAFFRWQFFDNPANTTGDYTFWIVLHQDSVIAQLGHVPFVGITPDGKRFTGSHPINLIVHPDYREFGLGAVLLSRLLKQNSCVLNPGCNEAGAALGSGLGMRDLGCLRRYILVINASAAQALALDGILPAIARKLPDRREHTETRDLIATTHLPDAIPATFPFPLAAYGVERNREFLQWRYEKHPAFNYEFLLTRDLQSILVFHEEHENATGALVFRIVDFIAHGAAQSSLLTAVVRLARERNAALMDFFCSSNCYHGALTGVGFFDEAENDDGRIAALFQPLDFRKVGIRVLVSYPTSDSISMQRWFITKGDSDQDRPNDRRAMGAD